MEVFFAKYWLELIFGLISAGALWAVKRFYGKTQEYKKLLNDKEQEKVEDAISIQLEPIYDELEELRRYINQTEKIEKEHMALIISSYRFRLIQLCKQFLKQGFITTSQWEQLCEFYKLYKGLGGNGQAESYYNKVIKLEVIPDKE